MRVAVLDDYQGVALRLADWKSLQPDVQVEAFPEHIADIETLAKRLHTFECVVLMRERTPLRRALIDKLPNLKLVITTGMQNASVDAKAALAERGIVFCGTDGVGHSTAELTWGLIIDLFRNITHEDHALRQGRWQTHIGYGLKGKTLGIIGLGRRQHGRRLRQGVRHGGASAGAAASPARAAELGIKRVEKDALFAQSDVVTLHVNLNDSARARHRRRSRPHEAERVSGQHVARADRRRSRCSPRSRTQDRRRCRSRYLQRRASPRAIPSSSSTT